MNPKPADPAQCGEQAVALGSTFYRAQQLGYLKTALKGEPPRYAQVQRSPPMHAFVSPPHRRVAYCLSPFPIGLDRADRSQQNSPHPYQKISPPNHPPSPTFRPPHPHSPHPAHSFPVLYQHHCLPAPQSDSSYTPPPTPPRPRTAAPTPRSRRPRRLSPSAPP